MKKNLWLLMITVIFSGCATPLKSPHVGYRIPETKSVPRKGIYHQVKKGETLWRISKIYDVELEKIVEANNLDDATKIASGQKLFIPEVNSVMSKLEAINQRSNKSYFIWPIKGKVISFFGEKRQNNTINKGIDILAKENSEVLAANSGKVIFCSEKIKGFGKTIILQHDDDFYSLYANNAEILVKPGQYIQQGERIAKVGKSQTTSDYILHFEIRKGHIPKNPFYFLP